MAAHVFSGRSLVMISFKFPASGRLTVIFISLSCIQDVSLQRVNIQAWQRSFVGKLVMSCHLLLPDEEPSFETTTSVLSFQLGEEPISLCTLVLNTES